MEMIERYYAKLLVGDKPRYAEIAAIDLKVDSPEGRWCRCGGQSDGGPSPRSPEVRRAQRESNQDNDRKRFEATGNVFFVLSALARYRSGRGAAVMGA